MRGSSATCRVTIALRTLPLRTESAARRLANAVTLCGERVATTTRHARPAVWPLTESVSLFRGNRGNSPSRTRTYNLAVNPGAPGLALPIERSGTTRSGPDIATGRLIPVRSQLAGTLPVQQVFPNPAG